MRYIHIWTPPSLTLLMLSAKARWNALAENLAPRGAWTSATEVDWPLLLKFLALVWLCVPVPPYWSCRLAHVIPGWDLPSGPFECVPCWSMRQSELITMPLLEPVIVTASMFHLLITSAVPAYWLIKGWFKLVVGFRTSRVLLASGFWKTMSAYGCRLAAALITVSSPFLNNNNNKSIKYIL